MGSAAPIPVFVLVLALVAMSGCSTPITHPPSVDNRMLAQETEQQREIALQTRIDMENKLSRIAYPLLKAAVPFCKDDVVERIGMDAWSRKSIAKEYRQAAAAVFDVGSSAQILRVWPASPADRAGVLQGDRIVSVNGAKAPDNADAYRWYKEREAQFGDEHKPVSLVLSRKGTPVDLQVTPEKICGYEVILVYDDVVNAMADGKRILVAKGLMRFVNSDQELSLVLAHEIAHNAMGHIQAQRKNSLFGTLLDLLSAAYGVNTQGTFGSLAALQFSPEFEQEADYVGLYIMARAGLNIDDAAAFWRRMAAEYPESIRHSYAASHPAAPQRFLMMEKTIKEIQQKEAAGLPLNPNYK